MITCPDCGQTDQVEDSVSPEDWDGYCYRCRKPFRLGDPASLQFQVASVIYEHMNPGERFYEIDPARSPRDKNQDMIYREAANAVLALIHEKRDVRV